MKRSRFAMVKQNEYAKNLVDLADKEINPDLKEVLQKTAESIRKCNSATIFEIAWKNYDRLCEKDRKEGNRWQHRKRPEVDEYIEWKGEGGYEGGLANVGLAKCKKIQCPLCCYTRSYVRRENAMDWAKQRNWNDYYMVSLTFTAWHNMSDSDSVESFKNLLDTIKTSLKRFSKRINDMSNPKRRGCSKYPEAIGYIASWECTFGKNGLHPHVHALFLTKSEEDIEKLEKWYKKDRVKVWKARGNSLLRLPKDNEDLGFQIQITPSSTDSDKIQEKIISYINKGLFETLSFEKKGFDESKKTKSIFLLEKEEMKYFAVFYEATRGMRFYRSGGICKEIPGIEESLKNWEEGKSDKRLEKEMQTIIRIENEKHRYPEGWISGWVRQEQKTLSEQAVKLAPKEIERLVKNSWLTFLKQQMRKEIELTESEFA